MQVLILGNKTRAIDTSKGRVRRLSGRSGKYRFGDFACDTPAKLRDAIAKHIDAETSAVVFEAATKLAYSARIAAENHQGH